MSSKNQEYVPNKTRVKKYKQLRKINIILSSTILFNNLKLNL